MLCNAKEWNQFKNVSAFQNAIYSRCTHAALVYVSNPAELKAQVSAKTFSVDLKFEKFPCTRGGRLQYALRANSCDIA